jgi:hypothetical protein
MSTPVVGNEEEVTGDGITTGIIEISESDVLCGRGGAALRHPGNQTYRRLVNLNKGLYITCLKTEKLKISRSIVAAIREQKGRFLEKETETSFYDIGKSNTAQVGRVSGIWIRLQKKTNILLYLVQCVCFISLVDSKALYLRSFDVRRFI